MPIHLFAIPAHIRISVIHKFDLPEFVNFHQCSKKAFDSAKDVKTRFSVECAKLYYSRSIPKMLLQVFFNYTNKVIETKFNNMGRFNFAGGYRTDFCDYPLRFDNGNCYIGKFGNGTLSEEFCIALIEFFLFTGSTLNSLLIRDIACSPGSLCKLVEVTKVEKMFINNLISSDFMIIKAIKNVAEFDVHTFVTERQILAMEALRFSFRSSNITSTGINQILNELITETRIIENGLISTNVKLRNDSILHGIPILNTTMEYGTKRVEFGNSSTKYNIRFGGFYVFISKVMSV